MPAAKSDKHTFVLVAGACLGGWCWRRVSDRLIARGHRVYTPSLTGLGERSHLLSPSVNLSTHIADIANLLKWEDLEDVCLVAHSYSGFPVSGAADQVPERIRSLVFVDAFVPASDMAMVDYWTADVRKDWDDACAPSGGLYRPPFPASFFKLSPEDAAWCDAKSAPHPYATMQQKLHLTGRRDRIERKTFILAEHFPSKNLRTFYEAAKADPAWRAFGLPCGHMVMLDMPNELADLLQAAA